MAAKRVSAIAAAANASENATYPKISNGGAKIGSSVPNRGIRREKILTGCPDMICFEYCRKEKTVLPLQRISNRCNYEKQ